VEDELRARWEADLGRGRESLAAFEAVCARYREPHRRYHTLLHVLRVLRTIGELEATLPLADPVAVRLAAWYHDVVYDVRAATSERDSAALARRALTALGRPAAQIALVGELVLATVDHRIDTVSDADAAAVLLDADLAVLAADPATYEAYVDGVRAEYGHLDDVTWRAARTAVLRALLGRDALFLVPPTVDREVAARANITAELARWNPSTTG
jgi:predicted metal-dependent HD superfamily phosphohydrolase